MNRRDLLKAATAAGVSLVALSLVPHGALVSPRPVEATALGRLLRGTNEGQVLESLDRGASWQVVANFGASCPIRSIAERDDRAHIRIEVDGRTFGLHSTDARTWRTPGALEPRV